MNRSKDFYALIRKLQKIAELESKIDDFGGEESLLSTAEKQVKKILKEAEELGNVTMMDLVLRSNIFEKVSIVVSPHQTDAKTPVTKNNIQAIRKAISSCTDFTFTSKY